MSIHKWPIWPISVLRSAWFIAKKDVFYLLRQKEAILWVFLMPFLFFYFIGTVTGSFSAGGSSDGEPVPLVLHAPGNGGFLVDELARRLREQNFEVVPAAEAPEPEKEAPGGCDCQSNQGGASRGAAGLALLAMLGLMGFLVGFKVVTYLWQLLPFT